MVKSEIDSFKCQEAIMNMFWLYKYMYFEHNFMSIDAVLVVPDDSSVEIVREQNLSSENVIKIKTSFEVHTYYPAVRPDAYNYKKDKIGGAGQDGIASDMVTNLGTAMLQNGTYTFTFNSSLDKWVCSEL